MAKKQVTVNEEMIRGIMAGDIPNYGKEDISVDDAMTTDESDRNECGSGNPEPVPAEKSTGRQKRRKDGTDSYRKQFLMGGNVAKAAGLYRYQQLPVHTEVPVGCSPQGQYVKIH